MGYKRKRTDSGFGGNKTVVKDVTYAPKTYAVKNKKAVKVKKIKKVKVSKALRAKITKVIDKQPGAVYGTREDIFIGGQMYSFAQRQAIFPGCGVLVHNNGSEIVSNGWHFTVPMFYDVANCLFGNKATQFSNMTTQYKVGQAGDFNAKNTKFEVMNSWSSYLFKNNTQHLITIKILIGVPKQKGSNCEWSLDKAAQNSDGNTFTDLESITRLDTLWREGLITDKNNGYLKQGFAPNYSNLQLSVLSDPIPEDLDRDVNQCQALKQHFKVEVVTLMLQPGQEVIHKIQGPQKQVIDFTKLYKSDLLQNIQKYSRNVVGIIYNSPNASAKVDANGVITGAVGGRFSDYIDNVNAGFTVHVERRDHYKIRMPEQTGFTLDSATVGAHQTLNKRFKKTQLNVLIRPVNSIPEGSVPNVIDLAVMNPQAPVQAGPGTGT